MNMADYTDPLQIVPDPETLHTFHRQQLSAMLDGELSPDAAKFMLRRLEHDVELARCWERWQVCGEVLRGRADRILPADFAARVALAVQGPAIRPEAGLKKAYRRTRWLYWGGAGMAASLALVAAVLILQLPADKGIPESMVVTANAPTPAMMPDVGARVVEVTQDMPLPALQASATEVTTVAATPSVSSERAAQELLTPAVVPVSTLPRPWPRAGSSAGGSGRFTVGYGASPVPMMDPFQPRWLPPSSAFWPEPDARPLPVGSSNEREQAAVTQN